MRDLNDLYYFVSVVDHGGFAAAARATNMQKSKLSRRIQQLEDRLGVRLLNRSTRQFSVTDVGLEYYDRCVAMLAQAEAADQAVAEVRAEPRGLIRVSCPAPLIQHGLAPLFARFLAEYTGVKIMLESNPRYVDVIAGGYDVAIRARFPPLEETDLVMRKLDLISLSLVVNPELLKDRPVNFPADLNDLPSIAQGPIQREYYWQLERADGQTANVSFMPRYVADEVSAALDAALAGVGIVQLPTLMVQKEIDAGRLVHVLPDWRPLSPILHAIFPSRRGMTPSVRALIDFLAKETAASKNVN